MRIIRVIAESDRCQGFREKLTGMPTSGSQKPVAGSWIDIGREVAGEIRLYLIPTILPPCLRKVSYEYRYPSMNLRTNWLSTSPAKITPIARIATALDIK